MWMKRRMTKARWMETKANEAALKEKIETEHYIHLFLIPFIYI